MCDLHFEFLNFKVTSADFMETMSE